MFKFVVLLLATLAASLVAAETAYFAMKTLESPNEFIIKFDDDTKIAHARKILSGEEKEEIHVMGRIVKRTETYNPQYEFYLDPSSIVFFYHAIEVCDANLSYVNDNIDEVCGAFLPGCFYCPWSSQITREVQL